MKPIHWVNLARGLSMPLLIPVAAWAQAVSSPVAPAPAAPTPEGAGARIVAFVVPLALLAIIIAAVKIYDRKKKRDEEAMSLEARISDALLVDSSLKGFPVVATVRMPVSGRAKPVIELTGTVPTSELRERANQIAARECRIHGATGRIEDRVVVDPLVLERVA